jgi:hypothetical protein
VGVRNAGLNALDLGPRSPESQGLPLLLRLDRRPLAFLKAGVTSFYGPALMAGFDENGGLSPYMAESVRQVLFAPSPSN